MISLSTKAIADGGKAAALVVVLAAAATFLPLASLALLPLMPLPIGYVVFRHRMLPGVCVAIASCGVVSALAGPVRGLSTLLLAGGAGVVFGEGLRRGFGFTRLLLSVTAAAAVAIGLSATAVWFVTGMSVAELRALMEDAVLAGAQLYGATGGSEGAATSVLDSLSEWFAILPYLLPGLLGLAGAMIAGVVIGFGGVVFRRMGADVRSLSFAEFRLHWSMAYGLIAGLALLLLAPAFGESSFALRAVGLNLILFFQALFFFQGLAVVRWLTVVRRMSSARAAVLWGVVLVGQVIIQFGSWVGLLDTWIDVRRRLAPKEDTRNDVSSGDKPVERDREEM